MRNQIIRLIPMTVALAALSAAQEAKAPERAPVPLLKPVQDKNFYLLSMIEKTAAVKQAVENEPALARIAASHRAASHKATTSCGDDLACYTRALLWSDTEATEAGRALRAVHDRETAVQRLVHGPLRQSGMFQRYSGMSDGGLLVRAWMDVAHGINNIIDVYGNGRQPRYPEIDSISYDVHKAQYSRLVRNILEVIEDDASEKQLFFQPSLDFSLRLLRANWRDEAGRLEPLDKGENAVALRQISKIRWSLFPYTAIVVPGAGNDRPGVAFSALGRLRVELAARRYLAGKAPLIIVSGGFVHPAQTPYAEAIEMRKALIADFSVPPEAILVDPHARHTTTNMRNAARLLYRYAIPFERPALVTTDPDQSAYIEGATFAKRCLDELGYQPYKIGKRLSPFDLEWFPDVSSLQADASDPLDP